MKVTFDRTPTFDAILNDPEFHALQQVFARNSTVRAFVSLAIRRIHRDPNKSGVVTMAATWRVNARDVMEAAGHLQSLYNAHGTLDASRLRGALIEGLVHWRLSGRYAPPCCLTDNATLTVEDEGSSYSSSTTIDVVGWDDAARLGECHDCKVQPHRVCHALIAELAQNLSPSHFKIAISTAVSRSSAIATLKRDGRYPLPANVHLLGIEDLMDRAPLQAA